MNKSFLLLMGILFIVSIINAQNPLNQVPGTPPRAFSYKAIIKKTNGAPVSLQIVSLRIGIYHNSINSTDFPVYEEIHSVKTDILGQMSIDIGTGTDQTGVFSTIEWWNGIYFLKIEVDPKGGTKYEFLSATQLLSVPYAMYSDKAGSAASAYETDPVFTFHPAYNYSPDLLTNGNTAYSWGDHATAGYLKSYIETDPIFSVSIANGITSTMVDSWNTAFGWGNHADLYRPISYVPSWSDIKNNPFLINNPETDQLLKYNGTNWINYNPNFLTTEVDGDITNELQTLSLVGNILSISGPGDNNVTFNNWDMDMTNDVILFGDQTIAGNKTFTGLLVGNLNANNNVISNVSNPIANQDAATKAYVDAAGGGSITLAQVLENGVDANGQNIKNLGIPIDIGDAATKSYVDALYNKIKNLEDQLVVLNQSNPMDLDGNFYDTVKIGSQIWFAENLRVSKFSNGDIIPDGTGWTPHHEIDRICWFIGDPVFVSAPIGGGTGGGGTFIEYTKIYGRLYTSMVINDNRNVCPVGWRVPNSNDWIELINYLGGLDNAARKLANLAIDPEEKIKFMAKPSGYYHYMNGQVEEEGDVTGFWSKMDTYVLGRSEYYFLKFDPRNPELDFITEPTNKAFPIRCIADK